MLQCVSNSSILNAQLENIPLNMREKFIQNEFNDMCTTFELNESEMIALITAQDVSLLDDHYDSIWNGLKNYSMQCMEDYKNAYIEHVYNHHLIDPRIEFLCDDLKHYITENTCINSDGIPCTSFRDACKKQCDGCAKHLLNGQDYIERLKLPIQYHVENIIDYACEWGASLNTIKYLFEVKHKDCSTNAIDWASGYDIDVVKYLFEVQHKNCTVYAIENACEYGHLDIVKYLFEVQHKDCTTRAIDCASLNGHLDIVKYLFEIQHKDCTTHAIDWASKNGYLDIIKYLFEVQHKDCTTSAIDEASWKGHLDIIKYLFEVQHKDCTIDAINWASAKGHVNVVKYLVEIQHKEYTNDAIDLANKYGHTHVVKYLLDMKNKKNAKKILSKL